MKAIIEKLYIFMLANGLRTLNCKWTIMSIFRIKNISYSINENCSAFTAFEIMLLAMITSIIIVQKLYVFLFLLQLLFHLLSISTNYSVNFCRTPDNHAYVNL